MSIGYYVSPILPFINGMCLEVKSPGLPVKAAKTPPGGHLCVGASGWRERKIKKGLNTLCVSTAL
jgi:hypothetical protein